MKQSIFMLVLSTIFLSSCASEIIKPNELTPEKRIHLESKLKNYQRKAWWHKGVGHYMKGMALFSVWAVNNCAQEITFFAWLGAAPTCLQISADGYAIAAEYQQKIEKIQKKLAKK